MTSDGGHGGDPPPDRPGRRDLVRVVNVYGTGWHAPRDMPAAPPHERLRLGHLAEHFRRSAARLPRILCERELDPDGLAFGHERTGCAVTAARLWLFAGPSDGVLAVLDLDARPEADDAVAGLLRDCHDLAVTVDGEPIERAVAGLPEARTLRGDLGDGFLPERHHLVLAPRADGDGRARRLIHAIDPRPPSGHVRYPAELNEEPGSVAAVHALISVLCGQPPPVADCAFLSVVQGVASSTRLDEIRIRAYDTIARFRREERATRPVKERRRVFERLANRLTDLELDLGHDVEPATDLGMLVSSARVAVFHGALFDAMALASRAERVSRMLDRMERVFHAELTAIQSVERRADDDRRTRWTVAVTFLSLASIPAGIVLGFFGVTTAEVDVATSMFDLRRYLGIYLFVIGLVVIGLLILPVMFFVQARRRRRDDPTPASTGGGE